MPSYYLAEAPEHQYLSINASLEQMVCKLLWNLFKHGMAKYKRCFHNLEDFKTSTILIDCNYIGAKDISLPGNLFLAKAR